MKEIEIDIGGPHLFRKAFTVEVKKTQLEDCPSVDLETSSSHSPVLVSQFVMLKTRLAWDGRWRDTTLLTINA